MSERRPKCPACGVARPGRDEILIRLNGQEREAIEGESWTRGASFMKTARALLVERLQQITAAKVAGR